MIMNGTRYYMKDEVPFQDFTSYTEKSGSKKGLAIFLAVLLLIAVGIGGLYFLGKNRSTESPAVSQPTSAPTVEEEPTPTLEPTPALERSDLTVSVLNGSGTRGAAGSTAELLRKLGYKIGATGNADSFNYEGLTIRVSREDEEYLDLLKSDLEEKASASAVTATVSASLTTGAEVIVGK